VLQAALRETNESFASRLGVSARAVAKWHEKPNLTPRADMQQIFDRALETATDAERSRFATLIANDGEGSREVTNADESGYALRVAVAIVLKGTDVLIVQRRGEDGGGISWQFPAGMVKPGVSPETVAVRETLEETGVHCAIVRNLGSRLHPTTHVYCYYLLCEYLGGDAQNLDVVENVSVTWTASDRLTRFIPTDRIFPPILDALEELTSE
jgi:8-oxo-dGTP pyrophosphatase MutT (NUDIX family)